MAHHCGDIEIVNVINLYTKDFFMSLNNYNYFINNLISNHNDNNNEVIYVLKLNKGKLMCLWLFLLGPGAVFFVYCLIRSIHDGSLLLMSMSLVLVICSTVAFFHHINIKDILLYNDRIVQRSRFFIKNSTVFLDNAIFTSSSAWFPKRMIIVNKEKPPGVVTLYPGLLSRKDRKYFFKALEKLTGQSSDYLSLGWNKKLKK